MTDRGSSDNDRAILAYNPEDGIWYYFSKSTHSEYVLEHLKRRVAIGFFNIDVNRLLQQKFSNDKKFQENHPPLFIQKQLDAKC
jgi:hypothetical protein